MALKVEIDQWQDAVKAYENDDFEESLKIFKELSESAKVYFNMGLMYDALGDHQEAFDLYEKALSLDSYMSIGHFQKGNAKYALEKYEDAIADFDKAFQYLRGNLLIDYAQLGMEHKLYSCEIAYNKALCYTHLNDRAKFKEEIMYAMVNKQIDDHNAIIPRAVKVDGKECKPFLLPKTAIFKPAENKSKNTKKVDYLGKSKVVGSTDDKDNFTGFAGKQAKDQQKDLPLSPTNSKDSRENKPPKPEKEKEKESKPSKEKAPKSEKIEPTKSEGVSSHLKLKDTSIADNSSSADKKARDKKKRDTKKETKPITPPSTEDSSQAGSPDMGATRRAAARYALQSSHSLVTTTSPSLSSLVTSVHAETPLVHIPRVPLPNGRLKVKVYFNETCVLLMKSDIKFEILLERVRKKYNNNNLKIRYKDEDGELILMTEQDDLDIARGYLGDSKVPLSDRVEIYASDESPPGKKPFPF